MRNLRYPKILILSKEEAVAFQLNFTLYEVNLPDTELMVLSYVYLHGPNAVEKLTEAKVYNNPKSAENCITKLRKLGLIQGRRQETKLNAQIVPVVEDFSYTITVQLTGETKATYNVEMVDKHRQGIEAADTEEHPKLSRSFEQEEELEQGGAVLRQEPTSQVAEVEDSPDSTRVS